MPLKDMAELIFYFKSRFRLAIGAPVAQSPWLSRAVLYTLPDQKNVWSMAEREYFLRGGLCSGSRLGVVGSDRYCGPYSCLIGWLLFPPVCLCPVDTVPGNQTSVTGELLGGD